MLHQNGFTLIELIIVIVILGILSVVAAPKFIDINTDAKVSTLEAIASQIKATNKLVRAKAAIQGLSPRASNPGSGQSDYVVDFGFGSTEVDFRNLCPEARGELGDSLNFFDFMEIDSTKLTTEVSNQYASIGYEIPAAGAPTNEGCYVYYNSFDNNCAVIAVTTDC